MNVAGMPSWLLALESPLELLLEAPLLLALSAVAVRALRRSSASARHFAWALGLAASLRHDPRFATYEGSGLRSLLGRMVEY